MRTNWAVSFVVASAVVFFITPALRRLAHSTSFFDHPAEHNTHGRTVPYLGGLAIMAGVLAGTFAGPVAGGRAVLLLGGAGALGLVGLIDDRRGLGPYVRLVAELSMAGLAYVYDVRAVATGMPTLDLVITVLWIAGMANAFNLMDNMDGLAAGSAAITAGGLFVLTALGGQDRIATISIALAGACLGFLAFNFRPATIFMGDSGALFLGFLLATLTLQIDPQPTPPASFVVPLLFLAVPLLDTATVTIDRLRHGRSPLQGGKDHLSHRLVARGRSREQAVTILIGAQMVTGAMAVLAGRAVINVLLAAAVAVAVLGLLLALTAKAKMYRQRARGLPGKVTGLVVGAGFILLALATPAAIALVKAKGPTALGAARAQDALAAARAGDSQTADRLFSEASRSFAAARSSLSGPAPSLGLAIPVLSSNLRAARTIVATGRELSRAGSAVATTAAESRLRVASGRIDLAAIRSLTPDLESAARTLRRSRDQIGSINYPYLVPQIHSAVGRLNDKLGRASAEADSAVQALRVLPAILGGDGPRTYFLAVQNNAEARATGGFIGNYGELTADSGAVHLTRFGRIGELNGKPDDARVLRGPQDFVERYQRFGVASTWQNVNLSPDLGEVTKVIADLYPQSGGQKIDGVVAVDPVGLAALLDVVGPVTVAPWPEPITSANVVKVTLSDAYTAFPKEAKRVKFIGDVARTVFEKATTADLGSPQTLLRGLSKATAGGHLQVALLDPAENRVLAAAHAAGQVPPVTGDSMFVTTQNAAGNKIDYYLRRVLSYEAHVTPTNGGKRATVEATATLELDNEAPASGLPTEVIGPYDQRFQGGENRSFVSLYSPLGLERVEVDGDAVGVESARELGRHVYGTFVSIPAGGRRTLVFHLRGTIALDDARGYVLELPHQPMLKPDQLSVRVTVPADVSLLQPVGLRLEGRRATVTLEADGRRSMSVGMTGQRRRSVAARLLRPAA